MKNNDPFAAYRDADGRVDRQVDTLDPQRTAQDGAHLLRVIDDHGEGLAEVNVVHPPLHAAQPGRVGRQ